MRITIHGYVDGNHEADEVFQECWVRILEKLDLYEPVGSFAGWVIAVSRNVAKTTLREKKRARKREGPAAAEFERDRQERADTEDESRDGGESMGFWEDVVLEALDELPALERRVITLLVLRRKTTREAAEALEVSQDTVREILKRGMARLKSMKKLRGLLPKWKGWE